MRGLEDWDFPIEFAAIDGDNVVVKWLQLLPGARPDGSRYQQSGSSTMVYAGDGKFRYQEDLLNMVHVLDDLKTSGWRPGPGFASPPAEPNRDFATDPNSRGQRDAAVEREPVGGVGGDRDPPVRGLELRLGPADLADRSGPTVRRNRQIVALIGHASGPSRSIRVHGAEPEPAVRPSPGRAPSPARRSGSSIVTCRGPASTATGSRSAPAPRRRGSRARSSSRTVAAPPARAHCGRGRGHAVPPVGSSIGPLRGHRFVRRGGRRTARPSARCTSRGRWARRCRRR